LFAALRGSVRALGGRRGPPGSGAALRCRGEAGPRAPLLFLGCPERLDTQHGRPASCPPGWAGALGATALRR